MNQPRPFNFRRTLRSLAVCQCVFLFAFAASLHSSDVVNSLQLTSFAQVDGEGVFLQQIIQSAAPLPTVRLCDSPAFGKELELSRAQVNDLIAAAAPDLATTNWDGSDAIRITRRSRVFAEDQLLSLLATTLQRDYVKDRGELELNLTQPWSSPLLPAEPLTVKILELPTAGVTSSFIIRFELCTAHETLGSWQASLQAHVWRDVWVANSALHRGEPVAEADIVHERHDILSVRDPLADFTAGDDSLEISTYVAENTPLLARDVRPKAVIHRGQTADATLEDGALSITLKVVALEDGAPGQIIQLRNPVSQRSLTGKVVDDQNISITL
jgi:flagella basal body P-ring formation protein FlgA